MRDESTRGGNGKYEENRFFVGRQAELASLSYFGMLTWNNGIDNENRKYIQRAMEKEMEKENKKETKENKNTKNKHNVDRNITYPSL